MIAEWIEDELHNIIGTDAMTLKTTVPACFDSTEQWSKWRESERQAKEPLPSSYCTDCTAEYQNKMILERRCEFPLTFFVNGTGYRILPGDWDHRFSLKKARKIAEKL